MKRRLLNLATILSLLLCVASCSIWVRSEMAAEHWALRPRAAGRVAGAPHLNWERRRWVGWEPGRLVLTENILPVLDGLRGSSHPPPGAEYRPAPPPTFASLAGSGVAANGERSWSLPGVSFGEVPAQVVTALPPPAHTSAPRSDGDADTTSGPSYVTGQRSLVVSWWLPALAAAVLPAARAWRWGVRRRRARLGRHEVCRACGYDLRATPDRCPECGTPAAVPTSK